MPAQIKHDRATLERVARMYNNAADAARAAGVGPRALYRILKREGIEPSWRKNTR
jgi:hypothetical protein